MMPMPMPYRTGDRRHWEKGLLALGEVLCRTMGALFVAKQVKFLPLKPKAERHVPTKARRRGGKETDGQQQQQQQSTTTTTPS